MGGHRGITAEGGTGKTTWTKTVLPDAVRIDLLESRTYAALHLIHNVCKRALFWPILDVFC